MSEALLLADELEQRNQHMAVCAELDAAAELRRLYDLVEDGRILLRRQRDEIAQLKAELAEQARLNGMGSEREARLMALNAELAGALRGTVAEMLSVLDALNNERMPHDGDEFHERLEKARAALAKVEASK